MPHLKSSIALFCILISTMISLLIGQNSVAEIQPKAYQLPLPPALEGPLAANNLLQNATFLLDNQINAPESLLVENGNTIYAATGDGKLVKIVDGAIEKELHLVSPFGIDCASNYTATICGRPLGLRRVPNTPLIAVADFFLGVFTVNFETGAVNHVYSSQTPIDGRRPLFLNDIEVINETLAFVSDSSDRWAGFPVNYIFMEMPGDGRLFQLDLTDGSSIHTVVDGLNFANGVQAHPDGQSVLVADGALCRILRYFFDGPKAGTTETFVENLPGNLDNIRPSANGETLFIAVQSIRNASDFFPPLDLLGPHPSLRAYLAQVLPIESIQAMYSRAPDIIVEVDAVNGALIRSYQDGGTSNAQSRLIFVSQASDNGTHLFLGSFASQFIAVVPKVNPEIGTGNCEC